VSVSAAVEAAFVAHPSHIAAVFVEPVAGNMGLIPPNSGFLEGLRSLCDRYGALLVFDEVMTGFRVALAGAQGHFGVTPDLTTFGKVIGGGLPVGAYGGRADLLAQVAPEGPVYQAGTLSGNPVAMTAGYHTLRQLAAPGVFDALAEATQLLVDGLVEVARRHGVPFCGRALGGMAGAWFAETPPTNLEEAKACDLDRFRAWHAAMLEEGVHLPPSPYEAFFVSLAHDADVRRFVCDAHDRALTRITA